MKKLLTLLAALAFATSLAIPGFATPKKAAAKQDTAATATKTPSKKHTKRAHKKASKMHKASTAPSK